MLVLSRKEGQCIMIDNDIELVVLGVQGDRVRIGIKAPLDVSIHREELYQRIRGNDELARATTQLDAQS